MSEILHRTRSWVAKWSPWRITARYSLLGDTPETVRAIHALNAAGLLKPNLIVGEFTRMGSCPRCGRDTAVTRWRAPSVCTGCRADGWGQ